MALRSWVSRDPLVATRKLVVSAAAAALLLLRQPSFHHQSQAYATAPDHTQGRINNNGQEYLLGNLPQTMRAAVFWEPGKPMTIEDLKLPRPQFGEVLVKTKACGVCHSDLHVINKDQPYPIPCVLGHEITGEVVEHGAHTDRATVHRFCAFFIPSLLSNSPTHLSILQFFLLHISFPTYPLIHFSIFFYYLSLSPPTHPSIFHFFFCYTISFTTYLPMHPSILQFSFATYLIPHPLGHKICSTFFATYLIPHPPTHPFCTSSFAMYLSLHIPLLLLALVMILW